MALGDLYKRKGNAARGPVIASEPFNASVGPAGSATVDVDTTGFEQLTVIWRLLASGTTTDLSGPAVKAYSADQTTLIQLALQQIRGFAPSVGGSDIISIGQYDCRGIGKVQLSVSNANVGAKTIVIDYYLGSSR